MTKFFYVYILQSETDPERFYTGLTDDLRMRVKITTLAAPFTRLNGNLAVKTYIALPSRSRAAQLELYLKSASGRAIRKATFMVEIASHRSVFARVAEKSENL